MPRNAAHRDENSVPTLLAVSNADGVSLVEVWADPVTHRLLVQFSGGSVNAGYQTPLTGGLTGTNTWTVAPNIICVDGVPMQRVRTDGTINWTGTTTTTLTIIPSYDIFCIN